MCKLCLFKVIIYNSKAFPTFESIVLLLTNRGKAIPVTTQTNLMVEP